MMHNSFLSQDVVDLKIHKIYPRVTCHEIPVIY